MHDLVIRNGIVVDGTGAPRRVADVAVAEGRIVEVGTEESPRVAGPARREIDAEGRHVLPGWVDIHTHYDGQATWDSMLAPSCHHGVTSTVFGNCSVGFAPVARGTEGYLINLMEGVEDIPGSVLSEGMDFSWESFPDYLDALGQNKYTMDIGAQVPHAALRFYAMGERGANHEEQATDDEITRMGVLTAEAIEAGALGFSTSRTVKHRAADGRFTPTLSAADREVLGIAEALGRTGRGVLQVNSDFGVKGDGGHQAEFELLRSMVTVSGRPLSFSLIQVDSHPELWRDLLAEVDRANTDGLVIRGQVGARPIGVLVGLTGSTNPWRQRPSFAELADRPLADQVAALRRPEVRQAILAETDQDPFARWFAPRLERTFVLGDPPRYVQDRSESLAARAERSGISPWELLYDEMLVDDGRAMLLHPFENYSQTSIDPVETMLGSPNTISGLSDGGAHVGAICDAGMPTFLLSYWVRERAEPGPLSMEFVVNKQTAKAARALGITDRGEITPGQRADLNVIDLDRIGLRPPRMVYDLPTGAKRLMQTADGYEHTFVSGIETFVGGEHTGELPGRLMRG